MPTMDLDEIKQRALAFGLAHPDERDSWTKAPLLTAALRSGDAAARDTAARWLRRAAAVQRDSGNLSYADVVHGLPGHVRSFTPLGSLTASLGYPLLLCHQQQGGDDALLRAAARQVKALRAAPRTSDGGIWARGEGPELWVDFTYLMCPFLMLYGQLADDADAVDEAFRQFAVHADHLVDPRRKLARHAWCEKPDHFPQSTFWARGNGWLICAAVDLLQGALQHPGAGRVRQTLVDTLTAMAPLQEGSGYLCHVLDDPRSNLEASGTLMYAYALAHAVRLGLMPAAELERARRAVRVVAGGVEPSGKVPGVAVPPGGPGVPFDWTLFGQGFFVLAVDALAQADARSGA